MDPFLFSLVLGGAGLGVMAATGLGKHSGHAGHSHGHAGHGHSHGGGGHGHGHAHHGEAGGHHVSGGDRLLALASPRVLFSFLVGVGATGIVGREFGLGALGDVVLGAVAIFGGIVFERFVISPLWKFFDRFESSPALTLESAVQDEAKAVTGFNRNGEGLVAIEVDGQVVQCLARLVAGDREQGIRVKAGDRVRVENVDAARNRCTVSYLG